MPARYTNSIPPAGFENSFSASGTLVVGKRGGHTLFGFFNHNTVNEWRMPNSIIFRINGRGDNFHAHIHVAESQSFAVPMDFLGFAVEGPSIEGFFVYPSYRVHGAAQSSAYPGNPPHIFPDGAVHTWALEYLPGDLGKIIVTLDDKRAELPFPREHQTVGARFNRFGFVTPWLDGNGQRIYFDDLEYMCKQE